MRKLEVGAVVVMDGRKMRHLGDGQFEPVPEPETLAKRFGADEYEPLHRVPDATQRGGV